MKKIVLLRHGESAWNKENRFTGWTDVDLTEKGVAEALKAGELLAEKGFRFQKAYTSYLKRAVKTLNCVLDRLNQDWIPVEKSWRLNEKHYGQLQGLNKAETAAKYGDEQVLVWRRSYDIAPHALTEDDPRNPRFEERYREVPDGELPRTESLEDAVERLEALFEPVFARRMQEKLWQALYYRYDFAKEYRPQLEENLLWLDGELKKLEGMQMRHRIIEKSDR